MLKLVLQDSAVLSFSSYFSRMLILDSVPLWGANGYNLIDELEEGYKLLEIEFISPLSLWHDDKGGCGKIQGRLSRGDVEAFCVGICYSQKRLLE
jgi:hypothetical protein